MENFDYELKIAEIIARQESGTISAEDSEILDEWLAQSAENPAFYKKITSVGSLAEYQRRIESSGYETGASRIKRKIGMRRIRRMSLRTASAAAVLALGILTYLYTGPLHPTPNGETDLVTFASLHPEQFAPGAPQAILTLPDGREVTLTEAQQGEKWQEVVSGEAAGILPAHGTDSDSEIMNIRISVPRGGEYKIVLADGTNVWLNSETVLEYPERFSGGRRGVRLSGEAFFDVARDESLPFEISTSDDLTVSVLGTKFNIHSYPDVSTTSVTLVEGAVAVNNAETRMTLKPCDQLHFDRNSGQMEVVKVDNPEMYGAWIHGMFEFDAASLDIILDALSKWYNLDIVYCNVIPGHYGLITLQAERGKSFEYIAGMLEQITGLRFTAAAGTVTVSER